MMCQRRAAIHNVFTDLDAPVLFEPLHQVVQRSGITLRRAAVAVSGGPDSAMLAIQMARLAREHGCGSRGQPHILHVHHGLQTQADAWADHVHDLARMLELPCHSVRVDVPAASGKGTEAAARDARYHALHALASALGVDHIFLAHHRDDQAETVLLRLLRGSGPGGLSAMATQTHRHGLTFLRPWLDVARADILQHMQLFFMATGWSPVYDPTNYHDSYTRSAVRERLAPALDQRWPGWQGRLARHARLAAQSQEILDEVAEADLAALAPDFDDKSFSLACWRCLTAARQAHVLRHWLARLGERAPTEARLNELMRQLRGLHALGHDRQMRLKHGDAWIVCRKGRVVLEKQPAPGMDSVTANGLDEKR